MKIIIPGVPVPQARMQHVKRGGFVHVYDPKSREKRLIRDILQEHRSSREIDFPRLSFLFHMPIPKSVPKRELELYRSGLLKHDKKPDVDNLLKLYLDCLDGIVFSGDQAISLGPCVKVYHPEPKTIVWVHPTTRMLSPWELDVAFLSASECGILSFSEPDCLPDSYSLWSRARGLSPHSSGLGNEESA